MNRLQRLSLFAAVLLAASCLCAQEFVEGRIAARMKTLSSLSDFDRPAAITEMADEIRSLEASRRKVELADSLAQIALQGDSGQEAFQAVAFSLANALHETSVPAKNNQPPQPWVDLAMLAHYTHVIVDVKSPYLDQALQTLTTNDADVENADFTLPDLHSQKFTLSQLRGKIVLINFWNIDCVPCRAEMPYLDAIYTKFQPQGLIVLSITRDQPARAAASISTWNYHPPVLFDLDGKVSRQFHVATVPRTFLFDRNGKFIGQSMGPCTREQFLEMLTHTDLKP